jgi:hypothetical protein
MKKEAVGGWRLAAGKTRFYVNVLKRSDQPLTAKR